MHRRTKIVCTLGPATDSRSAIRRLIAAGMNVARINCSHGDWETRRKWIGWIRELSPALSPIGILCDLQGPKFRIGKLPDDHLDVRPGMHVTVGDSQSCAIPIHQPEILDALTLGDRLLLGDGNVELRVRGEDGGVFDAVAVTGGLVRSKQGVTLVGKSFHSSAFTEPDRRDVKEACAAGVDFIAMSYVHSAEELAELKATVKGCRSSVRVCAKIETKLALKNLDAILEEADLAMVARGDLGLQMNLEDVPMAQKRIIRRCNELGKPVITATQMMESMITSPRPTRAEVGDVANAILDGTDAVMLSAETAAGQFPSECVRAMSRIARKAEDMIDHAAILDRQSIRELGRIDATQAIARAAARLAEAIRPRAILTTSTSGQTACLVSKSRPATPILCATWNERTHRQLSVVWGVESLFIPLPNNTDEIVHNAMEGFVGLGRLRKGDRVIVTAGVPAGKPGSTNLILNEVVR